MSLKRFSNAALAGLLVAGLAVSMAAPAAEAKSKHRRYKHKGTHASRVVHRPYGHAPVRVYEVHRHSHVPAWAGFIGGLALGAVLSKPAEAYYHHSGPGVCDYGPAYYRPSAYYYYDPYCHERFVSLAVYHGHLGHHRHPHIVRVIEVESGDWVHTYRYHRGSWEDWEDYDD